MAAVTVTVDNLRVDDAQANTGWANWGGGGPAPAAEPSYPYNGTNAVNKLSNATTFEGLSYTPTNDGKSANDHTATDRDVWMAKAMVADNGDLATADGVQVGMGSSGSNYRVWIIAGTSAVPTSGFLDSYSSIGGEGGSYLIIPIKVNDTTYRIAGGDTGTPNFASGDFYGVQAKFQNGNAKSENLAMAAIDFGSGLYLVGGTSPDAAGDLDDLITHDQGTSGNRYGYAYLLGGQTPAINGRLRIGTDDDSTHTATRFTIPEGQTVFIPDHLASAGWSSWEFWVGSASTAIVIDGRVEGLGTSDNIDSRPDLDTITDTTNGTVTGKGTFANFRNIILTDEWTFTGRLEFVDLTQASADLTDATLVPNSASAAAACNDPSWGNLNGTTIIQAGAGHAFEETGTTTITLTDMVFEGFATTDTSNDAALYFSATSGTITVNLSNVTQADGPSGRPSYRSAGVTVDFVIDPVTLTITAVDATTGSPIERARVLAVAASTFTGGASVTSITRATTTATVTQTAHGYSTGDDVRIYGADQPEYNGIKSITVTGANTYTYTVSGSPTTPATGTIVAALVIINGYTDVNGEISDTRSWGADQDFSAQVRKGTSSPVYATQPVAGTISSSAGASAVAPLSRDE